ncbi:hypothetical protein NVP1187O_067 [Vibrio phage 1.187.O._10N.286.49.F1]|nr:hypothetical protein NVP1187O_067 [Vibrio phage 1.187.O._10N.286.49.F1]
MTNLEAMQDADLRQTIHDVELLERLRNGLPDDLIAAQEKVVHIGWNLQEHKELMGCIKTLNLEVEISNAKKLVEERWRELLEED